MKVRALAFAAGIVGAAVVAALCVGDASAAQQTKQVTYEDTTAIITHGQFERIDASNWRFVVCGEVRTPAGAKLPVEVACVACSGAMNGTTLATCRTAWRDANGF